MFRNKSVNVHQFAMVPHADIPRSSFRIQKTHKTTIDAGYLYPIYIDEILPGDSFNVKMTAFVRMSTPVFPVMDNMVMETFFFFVPNRLVWVNWKKFMGEQASPADSISYTVPLVTSPVSGYAVGSLGDHMGLPTVGQLTAGQTISTNTMFFRAYNLIFNEWFRDENLVNGLTVNTGDATESYTLYTLQRRGKRHDYFTSCLPWTQKGGTAVSLPLGTTAPVIPVTSHASPTFWDLTGAVTTGALKGASGTGAVTVTTPPAITATLGWNATALVADLSAATAATINQIRQAFQIQKLLERDARGGTRYTEIVRSHFGVISPDARLQRPEYLGGGSSSIGMTPVADTAGAGSDPIGTLHGFSSSVAHNHGFNGSFTEHGMIIGLCSIRADLTYQQGIRRMHSRSTRYDYYFPVFAALGEQAVLNKEIYALGDGIASDNQVFGYQERWAEYRYNPSEITGVFRSTSAGTLDAWHLAQKFISLPTLNSTFIADTPPVDRVIVAGVAANTQQFLVDAFFDAKAARPLPMYSVPGLIDHF